jgi:hypothetical protein
MVCNELVNYKLWKNLLFLQFQTKDSRMLDIQVSYRNNQISTNTNVSLLGLKIDNYLTWKDYIDVLINKLNRSCFAIWSVKSILSLETLKMMYYSFVHSIWNYGIIFRGNSSYSVKVSRIQKRIIRVMTNSTRRASCFRLFRKLGILHSIFYQLLCLLKQIGNYLNLIPKYINSISDLLMTCITPKLTYHNSKREYVVWE